MPASFAAQLRRSLPSAAATVLSAALLVALSGCGSSHSAGSAVDPASVIPASAALYGGADVRPSGSEQAGALAAGKALTHQANPYLRLLAALQSPGSPQLDFKKDLAPWLGPHAGIFLTSLASAEALTTLLQQGLLASGGAASGLFPFAGGAQGAIVLDTTDAAKARSFLDGQAKRAGAHPSTYRGVSLQLATSGVAFALVQRLAVLGSEAAVHAVIDTSQGASALSASSGYTKLTSSAPAGALAHLYANPSAITAGAGRRAASGLLGVLTGGHQANVSLVASAGSVALDIDTLTPASSSTAGGLLASDPEAAQAFGELPGESWLAIGLGHLGTSIAADVGTLHGLAALAGSLGGATGVEAPASASTLNVKSLLGAMIAPLDVLGAPSAKAKRDYASWMGSAGIFASGGSLLELKAAIVIDSKNPALSHAAVGKLAAALQSSGAALRHVSIPGTDAAVGVAITGLPVVLDIANGRDASGHTKFVLGFAEASVTDALRPSSVMAQGAAASTAAASALGEGIQPSVTLDFPTVLTLLEGIGLTEDPTLAKVVPYLRAASTLSGGGHALNPEVQRFRLVLGLQHAGA